MSDNTLTFKLAGPSDIQAYRRIKMIINLLSSPYHAVHIVHGLKRNLKLAISSKLKKPCSVIFAI